MATTLYIVDIDVLMRERVNVLHSSTKSRSVGVVLHGTAHATHTGVVRRVSVATIMHGTAGLPVANHLSPKSAIIFWPRSGGNAIAIHATMHGTAGLHTSKAQRKTIATVMHGTPTFHRTLVMHRKVAVVAHGTATAFKGVKKSFSDHFSLTSPLVQKIIGRTFTERLGLRTRSYDRPTSATQADVVDLTATLQSGDITLVLFKDPASTVTASINPPIITFYQRDTSPMLRFLIIDDDTQLAVPLTGATVQFLVRRKNAIANIFDISSGTGTLTFTTALPNPTHLEQTVTASGTGQSVLVDTTVGTGLPSGTSLMNIGVPGSATYETCNLSNADGTHIYGIFTHNHTIGEPVTAVNVASPDPVYNAGNGYTTYTVPTGLLGTPGTYFGQLRIQLPSGLVQHSSQVQINVLQGF